MEIVDRFVVKGISSLYVCVFHRCSRLVLSCDAKYVYIFKPVAKIFDLFCFSITIQTRIGRRHGRLSENWKNQFFLKDIIDYQPYLYHEKVP